MTVSHVLHGIKFEWDSRKASINLRNHRISFEAGCEVFFDPFVKLVDTETRAGELREAVVGMAVNWRLLYVVYTQRGKSLRIISARPATNTERRSYENQ
ncbi:BrnT family toxin [candidate division KSB1 bacterium]|nr:BrnT family toxin [candidate division KSB1 bacterium]